MTRGIDGKTSGRTQSPRDHQNGPNTLRSNRPGRPPVLALWSGHGDRCTFGAPKCTGRYTFRRKSAHTTSFRTGRDSAINNLRIRTWWTWCRRFHCHLLTPYFSEWWIGWWYLCDAYDTYNAGYNAFMAFIMVEGFIMLSFR